MLADLLQEHSGLIVKYHEHDSLLENRMEEQLTEEERKDAWEEYEREKIRHQRYEGNFAVQLISIQISSIVQMPYPSYPITLVALWHDVIIHCVSFQTRIVRVKPLLPSGMRH